MPTRKPLVLGVGVLAVVTLGLIVASVFSRKTPPSDELEFLSSFRYEQVNDRADMSRYFIYGNPALVLSTVPGAKSGKMMRIDKNHLTTYGFFLPGGRHSILYIPDTPENPCVLMVDHQPTSTTERVARQLAGP